MSYVSLSVVSHLQLNNFTTKEKNENLSNPYAPYQTLKNHRQSLEQSKRRINQINNIALKMSTPAYYELYRRSTIGVTLADALDTLISDEKIQPQLANRILNNFDRIIAENLKMN